MVSFCGDSEQNTQVTFFHASLRHNAEGKTTQEY